MGWKEYCETGGGLGAFVWYAHGMPWAVASRPVTLTEPYTRRILGARKITVGATETKPYDSIPILNLLEMPRGWSMEYDPKSNWFKGGNLSIEISDEPNVGIDSTWYTVILQSICI